MSPCRTPSWILAGVVLLPGWPSTTLAQEEQEVAAGGLQTAAEGITASDLRATVYFLASDFLEGRGTPSNGLDVAAHYLAARFRALGLRSPVADGSYLQPVALDGVGFSTTGYRLTLGSGGNDLELTPDTGTMLAAPAGIEGSETAAAAALLFCGRAADLPRTAAGADTEGKILLLVHDPATAAPTGSSAFPVHPGPLSYVGSSRRVRCTALVVLVPDTPPSRSWMDELAREVEQPTLGATGRCPVLISRDGRLAEHLATELEVPAQELFARTGTRPLAAAARLDVAPARQTAMTAYNVAALLPGRDPQGQQETIVVSAHYDHLGVRNLAGDDRIFNGADDNASGTASVIELAAAFAASPRPPRRSLLFLAFCGEERGLLGSREYVTHPLLPLEHTVAVVNLEMMGRPTEPGRAWVTGFQYSDLGRRLATSAEPSGVRIDHHAQYSDMLFAASDNLPFAERGIVAHSISASSLHEDYHGPDDEAERLDYDNFALVLRGLFLGLTAIAEDDEPVRWDESDPTAQRYAARRPSEWH